MKLTLSSSPHQRVKRSTSDVMKLVIIAMIPAVLAQLLFFGWGVLIQSVIAVAAALCFEATILWMRKRPVEKTLKDNSAALTALLIAVSIPPTLPWWMTVIGTFFAIVVAKHAYGGLGFNIFNPAMVGYVVLLISFPAAMTMWLPAHTLGLDSAGLVDTASLIFTGYTVSGYDVSQVRTLVDGVTGATALDALKTGLLQGYTYDEILQQPLFNGGLVDAMAQGWGWVSLAYLAGGLFLIRKNVITWHIPLGLLGSIVVTALLLHLINPDHYASPLFHLLNGAAMIGAFFIATDPVSASTTLKGRVIYGASIGFWVVIIRVFGGYPDAVAFGVLITNMAVPLIDYYTQPRTYGHSRR